LKIGIASADYVRADRTGTGKEGWGGSGWARIGQYVPFLRAAGHEVMAGTMWNVKGTIVIEDEHHNQLEPEVVIMQRLMHAGISDVIKVARSRGQVVINDVDDWYWGLDPKNMAFHAGHPKNSPDENVNHYASNLAASDLLTVSTPYLLERLQERWRLQMRLMPNYIDVSRFTPVDQSMFPPPTFGWAGSTAHRSGDLETVAGVVGPRIMRGDIAFHHSGWHANATPIEEQLGGLPPGVVTKTPLASHADYPKLLTFDVGIVPLRDTPFNYAKSDIKGLEYSAAGSPFIAQASPSYQALHKAWDGAFHLAKRPQDWIKGVNRFIPYEARTEAQSLLLDHVKTRDIQHGADAWLALLEDIKP
jgi:hypothetical protein